MYYSEMKKRKIFRASNFCIVFFITLAFIFPPEALAARRRAGGGEIAKFNFGNYAAGIGIGIGAMAVGGVINAGLNSALGNVANVGKGVLTGTAIPSITTQSSNILTAMGNSLSYSFTTTGLITNMSTFMAVSQVGRAVGAAGNYYGWKPSTTFLVSSGISAAVGGFMNPSVALGPSVSEGITNSIIPGIHYTLNPANYTLGNMLQGAFVGGLTGLASGAVIVAIDGNKINKGKEPGIGAQIAGMVTGVAVGNLTRALVDPTTWKPTQKHLDVVRQSENPEIKNLQGQAKVSAVKAEELRVQGRNKFVSAAGAQAVESLYNDYQDGGLRNLDIKAALKGAWDSGVTAGKGDLEAAQAHFNEAQALTQQAKDAAPYNYQKVTAKNVWTGAETLSHPYSPDELTKTYPSKATITSRPIPNAPEYYEIVQLNPPASASSVAGRLFEATFVQTIDMWPRILVNSLSIAAVNSLGKKDKWLAPLVSAGVEGVVGPFVYRAQEYFPLKLSYLVGEKHLAQSVGYVEGMKQAARNDYLSNFSKEARQIYDRPNLKDAELRGQLQGLIDRRFNQGVKEGEQVALPPLEKFESKAAEMTAEAKKLRIETGLPQEMPDARKLMLADSLGIGRTQITNSINVADTNLGEVYKVTGTSPTSLFLTSAFRDMRFGLIDGLISGGIASLANKVSEKNPLAAAGIGYGAAMLSGAVRGAVLYATWEPSRDKNNELIWMDRYEVTKPKQPEKAIDWVHQGVAEETFKEQLKEFDEFRQRTGLTPTSLTRELKSGTETDTLYRLWVLNKDLEHTGHEWKLKEGVPFPRPENEIKPDWKVHIFYGLKMANEEFLYKAFSFGAPLASPENIDALQMSNYMNTLRGYAQTAMSADLRYIPPTRKEENKNIGFRQSLASIKDKFSSPRKFFGLKPKREKEPLTGWLTPGIISGYVNASSSVISNNIMGVMGQIKPTANLFNIQKQRLTLTNSGLVPVAIQSKDYHPWVNANETRILISAHIPRSTSPLPSSGEYFGAKALAAESKLLKSQKDLGKELEAKNDKLKKEADEAEQRRILEEIKDKKRKIESELVPSTQPAREQSEAIKIDPEQLKFLIKGQPNDAPQPTTQPAEKPSKVIYIDPKQLEGIFDGLSQPAPTSQPATPEVDHNPIYAMPNILKDIITNPQDSGIEDIVDKPKSPEPWIKIIDSKTGKELDPSKTKILWDQYYRDRLKDKELTRDTWLELESNPLLRGNPETKKMMQDALVRNWVEKNKQDALDYIADKLYDNRVVILGEEHQTIPHRRFLEQLVRNYGGERVNYLVVEFGRELQPLFDQYMQDGNLEALKQGIGASKYSHDMPNWLPVFQAARDSNVKVIAAEPSTTERTDLRKQYLGGEQTSTDRDLSIAQRVFEIRKKDPEAKILIHYGANHVNKLSHEYGQPNTIRLEPIQDRTIDAGGPFDKGYVGRFHSLANLLANNTPKDMRLNPVTLLLETFIGRSTSMHRYQVGEVDGTRPVVVPINKDNPLSLPERTPVGLIDGRYFERPTYDNPLSGYDGIILFPGHQRLYNDIFKKENRK